MEARQVLLFSNRLEHRGGANLTGKTCYRLFVYLCANADQIPAEEIYPAMYPGAITMNELADRVEDPEERESRGGSEREKEEERRPRRETSEDEVQIDTSVERGRERYTYMYARCMNGYICMYERRDPE